MANAHVNAVLTCNQFRGNTRTLLLILADAASPGKSKDENKKVLPLGWCRRKVPGLMRNLNCRRQQTVSMAITELKQAGAIAVKYMKGESPFFFVDLDWVELHARGIVDRHCGKVADLGAQRVHARDDPEL